MAGETSPPPRKWKCSSCGRAEVTTLGDMCPACKDKVRREAMGEQARDRVDSERELKRHGVVPAPPPESKEAPKK